MNCGDCVDKLEQYVDRELSDREMRDLKVHLADCPPCEDRYKLQVEFKRLIRTSCCKPENNAPEALRKKLREILF